jgi:hypothetical protein
VKVTAADVAGSYAASAAFVAVTEHVAAVDAVSWLLPEPDREQLAPVTLKLTAPLPEPPDVVRVTEELIAMLLVALEIERVD